MGRFFIGSDYHDDMLGDDGQLKLRYRYLPKEELERISRSFYSAEQPPAKHEQVTTLKLCDVAPPPFVKILQHEYEDLKRRSKRLEILERAFLECRRSEFEEFNDHPTCSFIPDKKSQEAENDTD